MQNTFKARLGKPEPVWQDEITPEGKKLKVRYLKLSYYCTIAEFPDALQWDGADMFISKIDPSLTGEVKEGSVVPDHILDRLEGFGMQLADYIKSLRK